MTSPPATVLIVEDGDEYLCNLSLLVKGPRYLQAHCAADAVQCDPLGSESVWHDGRPVGQISSGGYGYDQGKYLAFAYINPALNQVGNEFEVLVMGAPRRAVIVEQCVYDPQNLVPRSDA